MKHTSTKAAIYLINPDEVKNTGREMTIIREKATAGLEKLKNILYKTQKETPKTISADEKTNIFNVVILDQSGSMTSIRQEAINGYNETLQTIKAAQNLHIKTQNHFVTLVVFNGSSTKPMERKTHQRNTPDNKSDRLWMN